MINNIIKAFYPNVCPLCNSVSNEMAFCSKCRADIRIVDEPKCIKCGRPLLDDKVLCTDCKSIDHDFRENISVFEYGDKLAKSIYRFKYNNARVYAQVYAKTAALYYRRKIKRWNIDAIVAVPVYEEKKTQRGYNQAEEFAKELSKELGIKYDGTYIIRIKPTVPQKELTNYMRRENLRDAFAINRNKIGIYTNILIADDIYTTGSTIDSCANIMKKAGVRNIYSICIATKTENLTNIYQ